MVDILQVLEGATYMAFIVGALVAVYELRAMSKDRKTEFHMRIMDFWGRPEWIDAMVKIENADFKDAKEAKEQVSDATLFLVADHFQSVASMATAKSLDPKFIRDAYAFEHMWEKLKPWANDFSARLGFNAFVSFEQLANEERDRRLSAKQNTNAG